MCPQHGRPARGSCTHDLEPYPVRTSKSASDPRSRQTAKRTQVPPCHTSPSPSPPPPLSPIFQQTDPKAPPLPPPPPPPPPPDCAKFSNEPTARDNPSVSSVTPW